MQNSLFCSFIMEFLSQNQVVKLVRENMLKIIKSTPVMIFGFTALLFGCDNTEDPERIFSKGAIITNEGNFMDNNGSLSWFNPEKKELVNDVFALINKRPAGDVVQSFALASENMGVMVVNNSKRIEFMDLTTLKSVGYCLVDYPRYYCQGTPDKGYVTDGMFPGKVLVINTDAFEVTDTIIVGNQPERLLVLDNRLFITNGGWGNDNRVSVIDINSDEIIQQVETPDGPVNLVKDGGNSLWVLCQGKVVYNADWTAILNETDAFLAQINPLSLEVIKTIKIGEKGDFFNPSLLAISEDGQTLYVAEADGIYAIPVTSAEMPAQPIIEGSFYGLGIGPEGGIYALQANGFTSNGIMHIFNSSGTETDSYEVGIAPNGIIFY